MPKNADVTKQFLGVTLDVELVEMIKEAAALQASQRHSTPKVSAFLNEFLHTVLPAEIEKLKKAEKP